MGCTESCFNKEKEEIKSDEAEECSESDEAEGYIECDNSENQEKQPLFESYGRSFPGKNTVAFDHIRPLYNVGNTCFLNTAM